MPLVLFFKHRNCEVSAPTNIRRLTDDETQDLSLLLQKLTDVKSLHLIFSENFISRIEMLFPKSHIMFGGRKGQLAYLASYWKAGSEKSTETTQLS